MENKSRSDKTPTVVCVAVAISEGSKDQVLFSNLLFPVSAP